MRRNRSDHLLAQASPSRVLTCGFAGGLSPELSSGTVLFSTNEAGLASALRQAGAQPARIYCADRVVTTAAEKRALREATGAHAVEMESAIICAVCREQNIPCATVRVVLDAANENLPLDFNRLMMLTIGLTTGSWRWRCSKRLGRSTRCLNSKRRRSWQPKGSRRFWPELLALETTP